MSDNWVVQNLQNALDTWNKYLSEIWQLITQSPEQFKGGSIWGVIVNIHDAVRAIGLALLVLFFVVGVMRTCGSFAEVKKPEHALKLFIRFAIAKGVVTYGLELMMALFNIVQGLVSTIMNAAGFGSAQQTVLPQEIIDAVESCGFFESIPLWAVTLIGGLFIVETETTVTQTYLYITVSHKTAEEMAGQFGFNEDQREQMAELLADENNSLWSQVLYGITGGDGEIVTVALSQVGNIGGEPYWSWYGFGSRVEWCACFVSWCANECGYIEAGVIPKFAACASQGVPWFQERGLWQDNSYEPRPGDIIFFDWNDGGQDGQSDHVGIVEKVENGRVYTVEGNSGESVRQNSYPIGYYEIYGYGTPAY